MDWNTANGLVFGTVLSVIALGILTPLVYAPARGADAGIFSSNFGWKYIVAVFLFHWVYGLHIGLIYNPLPDQDLHTGPEDTHDEDMISGSDRAMMQLLGTGSGEASLAGPRKSGAQDQRDHVEH